MMVEHEAAHDSQWAAITSIAEKIGCTAETLRKWVRQAERDQGRRPGLTTEEGQRLTQLERENVELRRANEILKKVAEGLTAIPLVACSLLYHSPFDLAACWSIRDWAPRSAPITTR